MPTDSNDSIILVYQKNGIVYPVALTKEQDELVKMALSAIFTKGNEIVVCIDKPIGIVKDLKINKDKIINGGG